MDERSVKALGEDAILPLMARYCAPSIVSAVAGAAYNVADRAFVGRACGEDAIAAITVCFPPTLFLLALAMTVGQGSATLVSIKLGCRDKDAAEGILGQAVFLFLAFYVLAASLVLSFMNPLLEFFGATERILPLASSYYSIIISGLVFEKIAYGVGNIVRAEGRPVFAMATIFVGVVSNIFLDWLFLFEFGWGVSGAAAATVCAQAIAASMVVYFYFGGASYLKIKLKNLRPRRKLAASMLYAGMPSLVIQGLSSLSMMLFVRQARIYGSESAIAVIGISMTVTAFVFMPCVGISLGMQPIVGYNWGAGNFARVRAAYLRGAAAGVAICTLGCLAAQAFSDEIFSAFIGGGSPLVPIGKRALGILMLCFPLVGLNVVTSGYFQSIKRPVVSIAITFLRQAVFLVPFLYFLPLWIGLDGIWAGFALSDFFSGVFTAAIAVRELSILRKRINCLREVKSVEKTANL